MCVEYMRMSVFWTRFTPSESTGMVEFYGSNTVRYIIYTKTAKKKKIETDKETKYIELLSLFNTINNIEG